MSETDPDEVRMEFTDFAAEKSDGPVWERNIRDIELPPAVRIKMEVS